MQKIFKQKLHSLLSIDKMLTAYEEGSAQPDSNWNEIREVLLTFELPPENIMFRLIEDLCSGQDSAFAELSKYFYRFFDAYSAAAAQSAKISANYESGKYGCDREFRYYVNLIRGNTLEAIHKYVYDNLAKVREEDKDFYKLITEDSRGWYFETNWLDGIGGINNSLIYNRAATLKGNIESLEWLYENLADSLSRECLKALIKFWLTWDYRDWRRIALYANDVVDTMVYPFYDEEIFVDCGSYVGDTILQYVNTVNHNFTRVYTYDISQKSVELIKRNLGFLSNVVVNHKGTGELAAEMDMVGVDQAFHGNKLTVVGSGQAIEKVKVVRLDDDIREPVTFLKIDCEGMDKETLRGARELIRKYHPKLHVDSYHKLTDIVDVPKLIREIDKSYILYLRLPTTVDSPPRFPAPAFMAL